MIVRARCMDYTSKQDAILPLLQDIPDAQTRFLLLTYCAEPRIAHLTRLVPPHLLLQSAEAHDQAITQALLALCGSSTSDALPPLQAQLPLMAGGLGLLSTARRRAAGWLASWNHVWPAIISSAPCIRDTLPFLSRPDCDPETCQHPLARSFVWAAAHYKQALEAVHHAETVLAIPLPMRLQRRAGPLLQASFTEGRSYWSSFSIVSRKVQHEISHVFAAAAFAQIYAASDPVGKARLVSASQFGAGDFLRAIPSSSMFTMEGDAFVAAIALRLGLDQPSLVNVSRCGC